VCKRTPARARPCFSDVRTGLGYKRKDVALAVAGQSAVLTVKDFSVEIFLCARRARRGAIRDDDNFARAAQREPGADSGICGNFLRQVSEIIFD